MSELLRMLETPQQRAEADAADRAQSGVCWVATAEMPATLDDNRPCAVHVLAPHSVFIDLPSRAEFDALAVAPVCHGMRMVFDHEANALQPRIRLTKTVSEWGLRVVFQHYGRPA